MLPLQLSEKLVYYYENTSDYEVGEDLLATGDRLFARHLGAALFGARIGYNTMYAIGGSLSRTEACSGR